MWRGALVVSCYKDSGGGAGTARAKGLSPAAPAVPAQRRRPGGWKTTLWAHLGSSCRARARTGHVARGRPALEPARPRLSGGAVGNMLDMNTRQQGCRLQCRHACLQALRPRTAIASGAGLLRFNATSQLCDLKQTTQLL